MATLGDLLVRSGFAAGRERLRTALKQELAAPDEQSMLKAFCGTLYKSVKPCVADHQQETQLGSLRMLNTAWLYFGFLTLCIYSSNLTAILTVGRAPESSYTAFDGMEGSCMDKGCSLCVQKGAANEVYFQT